MGIAEWYASDVAAGTQGDVVGAAGFAGRHRPLAMALLRLFVGDNGSAKSIVSLMAQMLVSKAWSLQTLLPVTEAEDIASAVLAWHRDGRCKHCDGHGFLKLEGAPGLSDQQCGHCRGTGRIIFDRQFPMDRLELARWMAAEVDREQQIAGVEAMRCLAQRMP